MEVQTRKECRDISLSGQNILKRVSKSYCCVHLLIRDAEFSLRSSSFLPDEDEAEAKIKEMKVTHLLTTVSQRGLSMDSKFHVIDTQRIYKAAQFIHSALEAKGTVLIYYPGESVGWCIICTYCESVDATNSHIQFRILTPNTVMAYTNSDNPEMVYATMDAGLVSNVFEGEWKPVNRPPRIVVTGTEHPDATESDAMGAKGREVAKVANHQASAVSANGSLNRQEVEEDQNGKILLPFFTSAPKKIFLSLKNREDQVFKKSQNLV